MATSVIKSHDIVTETLRRPITWTSTSNPYFTETLNVNKSGYTPISVSWNMGGTGASTVWCAGMQLNGNNVLYQLRMNMTPSSTTQNFIDINITYRRD